MRTHLRTFAQRPAACILSGVVLPFAFCLALHAQAPDHDISVLTVNARTVVVDVVVTGKDGKPITGLHKEDFKIAEDGHPQNLTSFDEHAGAPQDPLPPLPPNVFTNVPRSAPTGSPIVLLLDSLNTPLADQTIVRQQIIRYLQHLQPGIPIAIFTLGSKLNFIQGFTDDPAILRDVAQHLDSGAGPESSPLLKSKAEITNDQLAVAKVASTLLRPQMAAALLQFQSEETSAQDGMRILITLDALNQLAHYLAGIPGRKSIAWFSGAFPSYIFPDQTLSNPSAIERGFSNEIHFVDAALSASQVAVYPIAAEGLTNDSLYDSDNQLTGQNSETKQQQSNAPPQPSQPQAETIQQQTNSSLQSDFSHRASKQISMDQIAKETGGQAFYNTNGIDKAIERIAANGSHFYTLSYTPSQPPVENQFRKIQVKLSTGHYNLAYRQGYFAGQTKVEDDSDADADPLRPFMHPGTPDTTQIPLALLVQPVTPTPANAASCAGDNHALPSPLTCYAAQFVIASRGLQLDSSPDGSRHGSLEVTLLAFDKDGKALNWVVRQLTLDMDAARFAEVQSGGAHLTLAIGIPQDIAADPAQGSTTLRAGVYDRLSGHAGTLSVSIANIISKTEPHPTPASY